MTTEAVSVGSLDQLLTEGRLLAKVDSVPIVVFWDDDRAWAIEDRCPHMGFPLHRGTVENGLVTCHWHHARFDLESGCTLDPWADDARGFTAEVVDGEVRVRPSGDVGAIETLERRLREGLEDAITLVIAKSVLGLDAADAPVDRLVANGIEFGIDNRREGWGAGLTVLVAMANLLPHLDPVDRPRALIHGLRFVANDVAGRPPRFALSPLTDSSAPAERLAGWYRRFIDTRSADAAERSLATIVANGDLDVAHDVMFASVTDHVFIDGGHTLDFTNKAFEALGHVGETEAQRVLGTLVAQTAGATRSEEQSSWRHPHDLAGLVADAAEKLPLLWDEAEARRGSFEDVADLAHQLLVDDPEAIVGAVTDAISLGATGEQLGRAVALAAGLRITRFHVQNDHSDWNTVHHGFTTANGLHAALARQTTPELLRGVLHGALRVYQDRFLNIPAARLPDTTESLAELDDCFEAQGEVDRAGAIVHHHLVDGGDVGVVIRRLGRALLDEDAGFHWYQTVEAGVRQALAWPNGSEEQALLLAGLARFLAAHTPTRREIPNIIDIAARLRRGATLYEGEDEAG